ncbi:MAG: pilus assembly protein PilM [Alphaproteobacteria bacterium]|nr:pilus assembly protein PilM [Alphaproteobacteria bacterium]MCB9692113.1 pilus assembly protein PilM [Alphaproteobacteria bacterium]
MPLLIAVDLGSHAAKVTTFRSAGRKAELEDRFSYPVPQAGGVPTLEARLAALQALLDDNPGWAGGAATIGVVLPGSDAAFRPMEMPFTDRAQVEKTLPFAIEGEVPYDLDDMVLGWRSEKVGEKSRVMSVLTRRERVVELVEAMKGLGMDPRTVVADGELFAEYGGEGTVAVVDIGHTHTVVSVVVDGEVRASRAINVGGHAFTTAIQRALECDWSHAEALKHGQIVDADATDGGQTRSGYAGLPAPAKAAMDGAIGQLLAEIRSTLIRFEDTLSLDVTRIAVCGGSSRIPELRGYLATDLGLPVDPVEDRDGEPVPAPQAASHALGRTLAGLSTFRPVDLRVGELAFTGGTNMMRAVLTYGAVAGTFFAVAAVVIFAIQYTKLLSERSELNARINQVVMETIPEVTEDQLTTRDKAEAIMTAFTADLVEKSELLPPANPEKPEIIDRLFKLTAALPPHAEVPIELSSLELLGELITFEGETDGFAQSSSIETALKGSDPFKRASKDNESRTTKGKVKFKFSIPLGPEKKEES